VLATVLQASCASSLRNPFRSAGPPAPEVLMPGAALNDVIAMVNRNADKLQSYQTNNASISVPGLPGIPLLTGKIAAQRPGRLRLLASTALTGPEVDLGSNDELYWFWVKRNEPPALYFARHNQAVGSAAQQLTPIEPQWLLDALGFMRFNPEDAHQGPAPLGDRGLEVRSVLKGRSQTFTRVAVIDVRKAWVLEQHIYDSSGRLIASTAAREHRYLPEAGLSLPQKIDVRIPAAEFSLSIDVGTVAVNGTMENAALWTMPNLSGYPQIDLGAAPASARTPAMGRQIASADWSGPGPMVIVPGSPGAAFASSAPSEQTAGSPYAAPRLAAAPAPAPQAVVPPSAASGTVGADAPRTGRLPVGGQPAVLPGALR
jgi:hypothetical protein